MILKKIDFSYATTGPLILSFRDVELSWQGCATLFAPSGSGKTTLFRLLSGWFGSYSDLGASFDPVIDPFKDVRFIGSHQLLLPWIRVRDNLKWFCKDGVSTWADDFDQLGLGREVLESYPYELSRGMYKRVELITAVAANPKLLLLDEFFTSFDDLRKNDVHAYLKKRRSATMTWVIAHEKELRTEIGGPQYSFKIEGAKVVGLQLI